MVTFNGYKTSRLEIYTCICGIQNNQTNKNKTQKQNVLKEFFYSKLFLQCFMDSWIRRIWTRESVGIKCAMYDQHVKKLNCFEIQSCIVNLNDLEWGNHRSILVYSEN